MKRHLNTLFVTTQGTYLSKEGDAVRVEVQKELKMRIPIRNLEGIVCFGNVLCSPFLLGLCAEHGVGVSFLTERGRFLSRVVGPVSGNVLLRREQYRRADDLATSVEAARAIVSAKVLNARGVLVRGAREAGDAESAGVLRDKADRLQRLLAGFQETGDLEGIRGMEGMAAKEYFGALDALIRQQKEDFRFRGRSRRPPKDNVNTLLSFLYTLLLHDVRSAVESAGLDPAVGFLHRDRPGRPSLALDLMEELRAWLVDRLVLSLINKRRVKGKDFEMNATGGVWLREKARKLVLAAYQKRKQQIVTHPFLEEKTTIGLIPHWQALLMARWLRGDLDGYPPFLAPQ